MEEIGIEMVALSLIVDKISEEEKIAINSLRDGQAEIIKDKMKSGVVKSMMKMIMKLIKMIQSINLLRKTKISRKVMTEIMIAMKT